MCTTKNRLYSNISFHRNNLPINIKMINKINRFTSIRLVFGRYRVAFVNDDVRPNDIETGSVLEYPELMSSDDLM